MTATTTLSRPMRLLFAAYCVTVTVAGIQLFVFAGRTADFFAWTVAPPVTAAFLGACYWGSLPLVLLAARATSWQGSRIAFFGVYVFAVLTLVATVVHRDRFHFGDGGWRAESAAWAWLAVYAAVPVLALAALLWQWLHQRPAASEEMHATPASLRWIVGCQGFGMLAVGLLLFTDPGAGSEAWPWRLTPLTARAVGAWLAGIGIGALHAAWEREAARVRPAALAYVVFGLLQAAVLARFGDALDWASPAAWCYTAFLLSVLGAGAAMLAAGWRRDMRATRSL